MSLTGFGVLQVEPTDQCNLRCRMCAPHFEGWEQIHAVPKGYLSLSLWAQIVQQFVAEKIHFDHIIFQWLGDPLLHPQIVDVLRVAVENLSSQVKYFRMDTNAILLTPARTQKICALACTVSTPILLVFTIDAHTPRVYKDVKGTNSLLLVRKNIAHLLKTRAEMGPDCLLNVQIQFVVQDGNAHECRSFFEYWRNRFSLYGGFWHDELMFKRLSVGGGAVGQAEADRLYEKSIAHSKIESKKYDHLHVLCWKQRPWQEDDGHQGERSACPGPWMTPVIRHDGRLMVCCSDLRGELQLGSLREASFSELWLGDKAQHIRAQHQKKIFDGVCKSCGGINWYGLTPERIHMINQRRAKFWTKKKSEKKRSTTRQLGNKSKARQIGLHQLEVVSGPKSH